MGDKYGGFFSQSSSGYTIITFSFLPEKEVDFRVQAQIGHFGSYVTYPQGAAYSFGGQIRGWSNTQTLTLPEAPSTGTPTPSPTAPEFSWLVIAPLIVSLISVVVLLRTWKTEVETVTFSQRWMYTYLTPIFLLNYVTVVIPVGFK